LELELELEEELG
jgi:hypothetical protein